MIRNPIWTTWAKYKKEINDEVVLAFAKDIADHGFTGQIEIDEMWEVKNTEIIQVHVTNMFFLALLWHFDLQ